MGSAAKMDVTVGQVVMRVILDIISIFIVSIPVFLTATEPTMRGFYCDDESIKYPYHSSTISTTVLLTVGFVLPPGVVLIVEIARHFVHKNQGRPNPPLRVGKSGKIPHVVDMVYQITVVFVFGMMVQLGVTTIAKQIVGRLRPNFLAVCRPDWATVNCLDAQGRYRYVTEDVCTGDAFIVNESRVSFSSGHASTAAYSMLFIVLYLQARWTWRGSRLVMHMVQAMLLYAGFYTAISRIMDNKHHPQDVLFGAFHASITAILLIMYLTPVFKRPGVQEVLDALECDEEEDVPPPKRTSTKRDPVSRIPERPVQVDYPYAPAPGLYNNQRLSTSLPGYPAVYQVGYSRP